MKKEVCIGLAFSLIWLWTSTTIVGYSDGDLMSYSPSNEEFMWGLHAYHVPFDSYKVDGEDLAMMASNGIEWISVEFAWRDVEEVRGVYRFDHFDSLVESARRNGLKIVGALANGYNGNRPCVPDWTLDLDEDGYLEALCGYVEAVVERYKECVDHWKIENEPNVAYMHLLLGWRVGGWSDERILKILEASYEVVRRIDPESKIILSISSSSPGWIDWLEGVDHLDFDVVGLQSYPTFIFDDPANAASTALEIRAAQQYRNEVVVIETGYHTFHRSQEDQARYVEEMVSAVLRSGGDGVFFYEYMDNPDDYPEQEKHFGLVGHDRTPKKAWYEYGKIIETYNGKEYDYVEEEIEMEFTDRLLFDIGKNPLVSEALQFLLSLFGPLAQWVVLFLLDDMADLTYRLFSIISDIMP
jgi:hypothetical protein